MFLRAMRLRMTWGILSLCLAVVLCVPQIAASRFFADDFFLLGEIEGVAPLPGRPPFGLYRFVDGQPELMHALKVHGVCPWFFDDHLRMNFFRPLGSLLLVADHWLFGLQPAGYVVSTCLWYIALVLGVGVLFRRSLSPTTAGLATVIVAISGIFGLGIQWAAAAPHIAAVAVGVWAYAAWCHGETEANGRWRWVGVVGFALALGFSESAFAMLAFPMVHEPWGTKWRQSLRRVWPIVVLASAYLAIYLVLAIRSPFRVAVNGLDGPGEGVGDEGHQFL